MIRLEQNWRILISNFVDKQEFFEIPLKQVSMFPWTEGTGNLENMKENILMVFDGTFSYQKHSYILIIRIINLRSATTNPTGKNKLEAGKKGTKLIANETMTRDECFLNLHSDAQAE